MEEGANKLYYVVGASGVGKDSLLNYARKQIDGKHRIIFAHRYITRAVDGSENYISLTPEEFTERKEASFFALNWDSHGNFYGIGKEIDYWMDSGFKVVVNGSREYLPEAKKRYPDLVVIIIEASPETIRQRLLVRGREDAIEIDKRMNRSKSITLQNESAIIITNDGTINEAGDKLSETII